MAPKTDVIEQLRAKIAELTAENEKAFNRGVLSCSDTISMLERKLAELEKEVERLKEVGECHAIDLRERDAAIRSHCDKKAELRQQLAIAEEHNARLLSALQKVDRLIDHQYTGSSKAISALQEAAWLVADTLYLPASREALDAYVADKVKEATAEFRNAWNNGEWPVTFANDQIATLTRQRDLAVDALEKSREEMACANFNSAAERIDHALCAIKEREGK